MEGALSDVRILDLTQYLTDSEIVYQRAPLLARTLPRFWSRSSAWTPLRSGRCATRK